MKVRFQADNDLDQRIVLATKRLDPAIDFQTASALELHRVPDPRVLSFAAQQGRVVVSHDRRTLPKHFKNFIESQISTGSNNCLSKISDRPGVGAIALALGSERCGRIRERRV